MIHRLRLSTRTSNLLKELQDQTLLTPNVLGRLAVGISLTMEGDPDTSNFHNNRGLEINRQTFTGDYDFIYKALIAQHRGRSVTDEEYFPELFNAHLERGISVLQNEYKYAGNTNKFYESILKFNSEE